MNEFVNWTDVSTLLCGFIGKARTIASEMKISDSSRSEIAECFDVYREYSRMTSKPNVVCKLVDELYNETIKTVQLLANLKELEWIQ